MLNTPLLNGCVNFQGPGPEFRVRAGQRGLPEGPEAVLDQPEGGRTQLIRLQGQGDIRGERYTS